MALMKHREPNMVKWQGSRPAHNGEQVHKEANAENESLIIHTVTAGKTFYLVYACLSYNGIATGKAAIYTTTNTGALIANLCSEYCTAAISGKPTVMTFWPPLELSSLYRIYCRSYVVSLFAKGIIFGWEE